MKNVIKREQCKLACGLPSVNILSKVSKFKVLLYLKKKRIGQAGESTYHGTHHPQSLELVRLPEQELNGTVLLKVVMQSQIGSSDKPLFCKLQQRGRYTFSKDV